MTLHELSAGVSFEDLWAELAGGDDAEEYREEYAGLLKALQSACPTGNPSGMRIALETAWSFWAPEEGEEEEAALSAGGYLPDDDEPYALGVLPLEQLVSMPIDEDTLRSYSPARILACILADCAYDSYALHAAWTAQTEDGASGLYDSEVCIDAQIQGSLEDTRSELGLQKTEDNKSKYGFLF